MKATAEQIDGFLALFDGNRDVAMNALRSHVQPSLGEVASITQEPHVSVAQAIVSVSNLTKEYRVGKQRIKALQDVSLDVKRGEFVAITAPSGSGKSTLLQLIGGLEKPSSGTVIVNNANLSTMSDRKLSKFRGKTIGFVFQFFYLQPFLNIENNIEVPGMFTRMKRSQRRERAQMLAEKVGIADHLGRLPSELSGGQIQRTAIVRALFNNPAIILADEPTGNLDSVNGAGIIDLFEDIRSEFGTTIIVATHDNSIAARADRVINLRDGKIA